MSSHGSEGHDEEPAEGISRKRIFSLSDLIFGLALSIGALTLIGRQPATTEQFTFSLLVYAFSFLVLISVWRLYSQLTSVLPTESAVFLQLNIVLLFVVSIEPYLFNELFVATGGLLQSVSSAYGIDLAVMFFILAYFAHALASEERRLVPAASLAKYKFERNRGLVVALIFSVSIVPYFGQTIAVSFTYGGTATIWSVRDVMWVAALLVSYGARLLRMITKADLLDAEVKTK